MIRRRQPLRRVSLKRRRERAARAAVVAAVVSRDGPGCWAAPIIRGTASGQCAGPLDAHELQSRGVRPGGHLDPENVRMVCRAHHDWITTHPHEAQALGLRRWSWEV